MRTNIPGIYAIGDVTGSQMYAYVASKEAFVAVDSISGGSGPWTIQPYHRLSLQIPR